MRYSVMNGSVQQIETVGGKSLKESKRMGIVFASLTSKQASLLRDRGCIVEQMGEVKAAVIPPVAPPAPVEAAPTYSPQQLSFVVGLEDFRALFVPPLYGENINIAVLDSGMRESHHMLGGRVVYSENFTDDVMADEFDHGTGVASVIVTIAPLCGILNMKVLDGSGNGTEEEVVLAIDKCIDFHEEGSEFSPSAINLSLGVPDDGNPSGPMRVACRAAIAEGIWVLAAAGNSGPAPGSIMSPACDALVAAVGSIKYDPFYVSDFSGRGPSQEGVTKPDTVMFGEDIVLASSASDTRTTAKSGTSFSVAFSSGMIMIYFEGAAKRALVSRRLIEGLSPELYAVTQEELLSTYLPLLCVKPEGSIVAKDNEYGYGLAYGPLVAQAVGLGPAAALDMAPLISMMMVIGIMGMMTGDMSGMTGG